MSNDKDHRNATQRIQDMETILASLWQNMMQHKTVIEGLDKIREDLQNDMALVKETLKILNRKTESIIQVAAAGTAITPASVTEVMVKFGLEDMKAQVAAWVANGHLTATDFVGADSYLVTEELNPDGTVASARTQFRLDSQNQETKDAMTGKKVGDRVSFGEGKFDVRVLEIYTIVDQPAPAETAAAPTETAAAPTEAAAEATTEVPAASVDPESNKQSDASLASPQATPGELPPESPVSFGLTYHGQPDPSQATA